MPIPNWQASDFFAAFQAMLPTGAAWPTDPSSVMNQCLLALMPPYVRSAASAANLLVDAFPQTTIDLIPEWFLSLGLPDSCTPAGATIAEQQAQITEKFTRSGGLSKAYYIGRAAILGYTITIVESAPAARTWTVHAPAAGPSVFFRAGQSRAGDLLQETPGNSELECLFRKINRAGTVVQFSYP
jgi:uncharacterized protein YmfQ (DUF2313 family)